MIMAGYYRFTFLFIYFFFYDFNLNRQGFVYLEFVKYQLGLHRNVHVFVKCNVCISAVQLFDIQTCPGFPITKTRLLKYTENFTTKKGKISDKNLIFFIFLLKT